MRHGFNRVPAIMVSGLLLVGLTGCAAPHFSPPREGGRGHAVPAVAAAPPHPEPGVPAHLSAAPARRRPTPAVPAPTLIATLRAPTSYRAVPRLDAPVAGTLPATNPFRGAQVLAVLGSPAAGWLHVELPIRPNGSAGWIRAAQVSLSQTSYHVYVSVAARTVTVTTSGRLLLRVPAAVGKPSTPTPAGQTYLWELIRPDSPNGAYGPYIFGLGWFSDTYAVFNGGDAQIGIHGQDEPWSLGQPVSHGCVRLPNDVITRLAGLLPLGTPVTIS